MAVLHRFSWQLNTHRICIILSSFKFYIKKTEFYRVGTAIFVSTICVRGVKTPARLRICVGSSELRYSRMLYLPSRQMPYKTYKHMCFYKRASSLRLADGSVLKQSHQSKPSYTYMIWHIDEYCLRTGTSLIEYLKV